ncbi:MAG: DUF4157 domain-containing protein, partial [Parachlamydiaceae bacterium]|nr:DUF4157 domain-containing protein [Parachlamydiaceae bacterium]
MLTPAKQTENQATKTTATNGSFFGNGGSAPFFQAKLTVNQPGDVYEQEADKVADQVVQRLENPLANNAPIEVSSLFNTVQPAVAVQTKCDACGEEEEVQRKEEKGEEKEKIQRKTASGSSGQPNDDDLAGRLQATKGGGSPLPKDTREGMEGAFGADFSTVRIHTGSEAVGMSRDIQARAFTHGSDVYFNEGEFDAGSGEGKRLLAHELVHVGQQNGEGQIHMKSEKETVSDSELTENEKERLRNELKIINYIESGNPNLFYSIRKKVLSEYWDIFYVNYFMEEFGIEKDGNPLNWEEFNAAFVIDRGIRNLTLELPPKRPSLLKEKEKNVFNDDAIDQSTSEENTSNLIIDEPIIMPSNEDSLPGSDIWNYNEYEYVNKSQRQIDEENWNPQYSAFSDPIYGKDVNLYVELSSAQKEYYRWDEIRTQWKEVNHDSDIGKKTLDQWIRKHIKLGWKPGDNIPYIKETKVKFDNEIPTIQAFSYSDAFKKAGEIGLTRNTNSKFIWERKISGKTTTQLYNFAPPDVYYNRTYLDKLQKKQYLEDMYTILENDELYQTALLENGFEDQFTLMVRRTQMRLGEKPEGKLTPEMIEAFRKKANEIRETKGKNQEKAIESEKKDSIEKKGWNQPKWTYVGKADDGVREVYEYKWRDYPAKTVALSSNFLDVVNKASSGADVDSEIETLQKDEIFALPFNIRKQCIMTIATGDLVGPGDEESICRLLEHVPQDQYDDIALWMNSQPKDFNKIKKEVEHDDVRKKFNNLMADRYSKVEKNGQLVEGDVVTKSLEEDYESFRKETLNDSYSADSEAYKMPDKLMRRLEYEHKEYNEKTGKKIYVEALGQKIYRESIRIKSLKVVLDGFLVGDEDEETLSNLLTYLPENEIVAKQVRREIAEALLDHKYLQFTFLSKLHTFTHGNEYTALKNALDTIYKENGDLLAGRIEEKLDDPNKDFTHIEYFSTYASKEVFKYLDDDHKFKLIEAIEDGLWEGGDDEEAIIAILESVGLQEERQAEKAASELEYDNFMTIAKAKKQSFADKILYEDGSKKFLILWNSIGGDNYIKIERLLNEMDLEHADASKNLANKSVSNEDKRYHIKYMSE